MPTFTVVTGNFLGYPDDCFTLDAPGKRQAEFFFNTMYPGYKVILVHETPHHRNALRAAVRKYTRLWSSMDIRTRARATGKSRINQHTFKNLYESILCQEVPLGSHDDMVDALTKDTSEFIKHLYYKR